MSHPDFLPANYEAPKTGGNYMKFAQWENRFRILQSPIIGWVDWKEEDGKRKPVRTKEKRPALGEKQPKHFWAMKVWSYDDQSIMILEITQTNIRNNLMSLVKDDDWGTPLMYDLVVIRKGEGLDTEYTVNPKPKKDLDPAIIEAELNTYVNLEALFENADPFTKPTDKTPEEEERF